MRVGCTRGKDAVPHAAAEADLPACAVPAVRLEDERAAGAAALAASRKACLDAAAAATAVSLSPLYTKFRWRVSPGKAAIYAVSYATAASAPVQKSPSVRSRLRTHRRARQRPHCNDTPRKTDDSSRPPALMAIETPLLHGGPTAALSSAAAGDSVALASPAIRRSFAERRGPRSCQPPEPNRRPMSPPSAAVSAAAASAGVRVATETPSGSETSDISESVEGGVCATRARSFSCVAGARPATRKKSIRPTTA